MLMRYYAGLAVGHAYAHGQTSFDVDQQAANGTCGALREDDQEFESATPGFHMTTVVDVESDSETSFVDQDDLIMDDWDANLADSDISDDEAFLGMHEMHGVL